MYVGSIVINFRVINGYWRIVHHHRVGGVTTAAAWVGLGDSFGNLPMETMLSCGVLRTLKIIWDTTSKIKTRGEVASQELSTKNGNREKENVSIGGLLPHKEKLCFIEGPSVLNRSRRTRMELGSKELGQAYNRPEQVMERMNNYDTRTSDLQFLTSTPSQIPCSVLWDSDAVHEVHPSAKVVPLDQKIG